MRYLYLLLAIVFVGCGSGGGGSIEETGSETQTTPTLLGTFSYNEDTGSQFDENNCNSTCGLDMWSVIRVYDASGALSALDTDGSEVIAGTYYDDGTFDYDFQFGIDEVGTLDEMSCTASTETIISGGCPVSGALDDIIIRSTCTSSSTGQCVLFYQEM